MKKWSLFLGIYFCLCLILGGCGAAQTAGKTGGSDPAGASVSGEDLSAGGTEAAEGVTETGVQYPLTDGTLANGFPMGVSNHILEDEAAVSVRHGALLLGWELPAAGE